MGFMTIPKLVIIISNNGKQTMFTIVAYDLILNSLVQVFLMVCFFYCSGCLLCKCHIQYMQTTRMSAFVENFYLLS